MTQQDDITQPVLTDSEILAIGAMHGRPSVALLPMFRALEGAVLSKLRAPVAPEPFRAAFANGVLPATRFHELWESAAPSKNSGHTMLEDLTWQVGKFAALVAAEVSAPVADERQGDIAAGLQDSAYCAGLQRGFMLGNHNDNDGLRQALESRDGYVKTIKDARAALASAPVAGEYTSAMGEAAQAYFDSFLYAHKLPAQFRWSDLWSAMSDAAPQASEAVSQPLIARALDEWHEDDGPVTWWAWCGHEWAGEAPWCGTPLDRDWPGYHTHWTPIPGVPAALPALQASAEDALTAPADVAQLVAFIFDRFGQPGDAGALPDNVAAAVRRLERGIKAQADKDGEHGE